MFANLVLLFTVVPAIELVLLIKVGSYIGAINTLLIIVFTGVLGAYLARMQGFIVLQKIQKNINKGVMPSEELMDGVMILIGGIVLLTPGFITDFIGFSLLIPLTRLVIKKYLRVHIENMIRRGQIVQVNSMGPGQKFDDIDIN
ncbi:MAG: membrane protein FxsA [Candidatus Omnitrophica bacterium]|nr:membrane protein FxsA [Candidatus Omnitrophota bacterium]